MLFNGYEATCTFESLRYVVFVIEHTVIKHRYALTHIIKFLLIHEVIKMIRVLQKMS